MLFRRSLILSALAASTLAAECPQPSDSISCTTFYGTSSPVGTIPVYTTIDELVTSYTTTYTYGHTKYTTVTTTDSVTRTSISTIYPDPRTTTVTVYTGTTTVTDRPSSTNKAPEHKREDAKKKPQTTPPSTTEYPESIRCTRSYLYPTCKTVVIHPKKTETDTVTTVSYSAVGTTTLYFTYPQDTVTVAGERTTTVTK